jgi:hypothetical protein
MSVGIRGESAGLYARNYLTALQLLAHVRRDAAQLGSDVDEGVQGGLQPGQLPGGPVELVDDSGVKVVAQVAACPVEEVDGAGIDPLLPHRGLRA